MSLLHNKGALSDQYIDTFIPALKDNALQGMQVIINYMKEAGHSFPADMEQHAKIIMDATDLKPDVAKAITALWKNKDFQVHERSSDTTNRSSLCLYSLSLFFCLCSLLFYVLFDEFFLISKNTTKENAEDAQLQGGVSGAKYYFTHAERFAAAGFRPTTEDMLNCRRKTTGIVETEFTVGMLRYYSFLLFVFILLIYNLIFLYFKY